MMKFEIKHPEYVNRTYRIPKELADKLSQIAQQENISVNELVVQSSGDIADCNPRTG